MTDAYRRRIPVKVRVLDALLYVAFFPQLVAGPILRAATFLPALAQPRDPANIDTPLALQRLGFGLFKKVVLAQLLASALVDPVFDAPAEHSSLEVLLGVYGYAAQIFCDFSGYTDIARGGSQMLGFDLPENFDYPYLSRSITEFWRRWHMTLSRWLRDYLYIPLGGNRGGPFATYRNLFITMTLGGLWHGARITFVIWGAYHGILLALHKLFTGATGSSPQWKRARENVFYKIVATLGTLVLVMIGWVFFRAQTFRDATAVLKRIVVAWPAVGWKPTKPLELVGWYLFAVCVLHAAGGYRLGLRTNQALPAAARGLFWATMVMVLYWFASTSPTFIYFYF
jgi:D-alanyl-lipoteichoic acid acyltransferase DltB (MBOAT superfamily)